ncbi:hypothetical protein NP233_g7045 [Leucocoprinus birnbaumii]|uniref:Uncharacterized protein n=1 Tax=Leucocoprinus birnbaumii TaxID=56174 RepID=A0AAD5YT55_9AGAR|nr:hypothetical protein NP233_g7045 [Leucocoprinus birnbaumii]
MVPWSPNTPVISSLLKEAASFNRNTIPSSPFIALEDIFEIEKPIEAEQPLHHCVRMAPEDIFEVFAAPSDCLYPHFRFTC